MSTLHEDAAEVLTPRPVHPVRVALKEAGLKLACLIPHTIVGEPDMEDARKLQDDLLALARIIDPVIKEMGHYAQRNFGRLDMTLFEDQLRGALEGNATFELETRGRLYQEEYAL